MNAIVVEGVSKTYPDGFRGKKVAVEGLSFEVPQGAVFGFLGPNGAGKSTTIKILLNLIVPTTGRATILDRPVTDKAIRSRVGYLPENPNFYDYLTPEELLWFGGKTSGMTTARIRERTDQLLRLVDLGHVRRKRLRTFSKGMLQRAGVGLALINDPDVVVFDEPMSGLDPLGRKLMADIIRGLKQEGKTIFFSSHILHDVEDLCDHVGIMVKGRLRRVARLAELLSAKPAGWKATVRRLSDGARARLAGLSWTCSDRGGFTDIQIHDQDLGAALDAVRDLGDDLVEFSPLRPTLEDIVLQEVERAEGGTA